jgi:signal transduction histidine kinase
MLSNALNYRSDDRKLVIDINSGHSNQYIWLSFKDNGTGIDLDYFGKDMFKPFKRFVSTPVGSGLGLHLVKSIVTKNGGKIKVKSKKGEGTTFKIYLVEYNNK